MNTVICFSFVGACRAKKTSSLFFFARIRHPFERESAAHGVISPYLVKGKEGKVTMPQASALCIWYHDEAEVDSANSWIANSAFLTQEVTKCSFQCCPYSQVLALTEYARPDFVLTLDGMPLLSAELTRMNPSGHNLPQRFSCLVRASELGVPSLFYYPKEARRSNSDPNVRYVNPRILLAQLRLTSIYNVPSVSLFWPTDPVTKLPSMQTSAHTPLAGIVESVARLALEGKRLSPNEEIAKSLLDAMRATVSQIGKPPRKNLSYRSIYPQGDDFTRSLVPGGFDPPTSCTFEKTSDLLDNLYREIKNMPVPRNQKTQFLQAREYTLVYSGTPNANKDGPEHPYPGYLTLLDILYARNPTGQTPRDRSVNLGFRLPIAFKAFTEKALDRPTGLNILMEFADLVILNDAVIVGGWLRNLTAGAVLVRRA